MTQVAIYLRISLDRSGDELAVERQEEDCRRLAAEHGWTVAYVLTDNSISATNGKHRPAYAQLKELVATDAVDVVVTWNHDRLLRLPRELEEWIPLCDGHGIPTYTVKAGHYDLTTPSGRAVARTLAAWANYETETATMRMLSARDQIARSGARHKAARVYGWNDDGLTVRTDEAAIVNEIADLIIAGYSQVSIAKRLNGRQVPTSRGKCWTGIGVRKAAIRLSNIAIREHRGAQYPGNWEPIFNAEKMEEVVAAIAGRDTLGSKRGVGRVHLLTGFVYCGECGAKLGIGKGNSNSASAYRCNAMKSHEAVASGCGRVERQSAPIEHLVSAAVLERLDSDALLVAVNQAQDDKGESAALVKQRQVQQKRVDDIIEDYASGLLKRPQFAAAKATAEAALEATERKLASLTYKHTLTGIDLTKKLSETWETASIDWKRSVLDMLVERIVINKRERHFRRVYYETEERTYWFDPSLVDIEWKL